MNESWLLRVCDTACSWHRHVTYTNESCHTYGWLHGTHMNESYHTYKFKKKNLWICHMTHMNASCHTCECVMLHIWMSHVCACARTRVCFCGEYESVSVSMCVWDKRVMSHLRMTTFPTITVPLHDQAYSWHTSECVMTHTHMRICHGPHMNES